MKKVVTWGKPKYFILVEIEFNENDEVLSEQYISKRDRISKKLKLTDAQIQKYNDIVETIMNIIANNDFEIKENRQSNSSYSYYIRFKPAMYEGIQVEPVEVRFRISDHMNKKPNRFKKDGSTPIIHTIKVNHKDVTSGISVIKEVREICTDLKARDYSSVLTE